MRKIYLSLLLASLSIDLFSQTYLYDFQKEVLSGKNNTNIVSHLNPNANNLISLDISNPTGLTSVSYLLETNHDFDILKTKLLDFQPGSNKHYDIIFSEKNGYLLVGQYNDEGNLNGGSVLKLDNNFNIEWYKVFPDLKSINKILLLSDCYIILGDGQMFGTNTSVIKLDFSGNVIDEINFTGNVGINGDRAVYLGDMTKIDDHKFAVVGTVGADVVQGRQDVNAALILLDDNLNVFGAWSYGRETKGNYKNEWFNTVDFLDGNLVCGGATKSIPPDCNNTTYEYFYSWLVNIDINSGNVFWSKVFDNKGAILDVSIYKNINNNYFISSASNDEIAKIDINGNFVSCTSFQPNFSPNFVFNVMRNTSNDGIMGFEKSYLSNSIGANLIVDYDNNVSNCKSVNKLYNFIDFDVETSPDFILHNKHFNTIDANVDIVDDFVSENLICPKLVKDNANSSKTSLNEQYSTADIVIERLVNNFDKIKSIRLVNILGQEIKTINLIDELYNLHFTDHQNYILSAKMLDGTTTNYFIKQ